MLWYCSSYFQWPLNMQRKSNSSISSFTKWSFGLNVEQGNIGGDEIFRAIHKGRKTPAIVMKEFPISSDGGGDKISLTMAIIWGKAFSSHSIRSLKAPQSIFMSWNLTKQKWREDWMRFSFVFNFTLYPPYCKKFWQISKSHKYTFADMEKYLSAGMGIPESLFSQPCPMSEIWT